MMRRDRTRRSLGFVAALALAAVLLPTTAAAQEVTQGSAGYAETTDTVFLKNGGVVRGRITESIEGDHVTIVIDDGISLTLPWNEVHATGKPPSPSPPEVDSSSRGERIVGLTLLITGSIFAAKGAVIALLGALLRNTAADGYGLVEGGLIIGGAGLAVGAIGGSILALIAPRPRSGNRTHLETPWHSISQAVHPLEGNAFARDPLLTSRAQGPDGSSGNAIIISLFRATF